MYVCLCKAISDSDVRNAVQRGFKTSRELMRELGVGTGCGSCICDIQDLVEESRMNASGPGAGSGRRLPLIQVDEP